MEPPRSKNGGKWVRFYFLVEVSSIKSGDFELEEQENWLVMCG